MESYKAQYYNEALMHDGIKGMKWGVRRASRKRRIAKVDKKIAKLKAKQASQEARLRKQIKERGYGSARPHQNPRFTAKQIGERQVQRASIKRGDSRRATRLERKKYRIGSDLYPVINKIAATGNATPAEMMYYDHALKKAKKINAKLEKEKKKKR